MTFQSLLSLVAKETDRQHLADLARDYAGTNQAARARREETLDQIMHQVQLHFRALRHPMPTKAELEQMLLKPPSSG